MSARIGFWNGRYRARNNKIRTNYAEFLTLQSSILIGESDYYHPHFTDGHKKA